MNLKRMRCLIFISLLLFSFLVGAEEVPFDKEAFIESGKVAKVLEIGLVDCVTFALKNNSEVKIKKIEPLIADANIKIEEAEFDPTLSFEGSWEETRVQSSSTTYPVVHETRTGKFNVGIDGKIITGTEYDIDFNNKRYRTEVSTQRFNPYYESEAAITITQPIFKDFGILVNKADIIIARNDKSRSKEDFIEEVIEVVSKTKQYYYDYLLYLEQYKTAQISLERAKNLLKITQSRAEQGLVSSVDLLEAETGVAKKEEDLLAIEGALELAEDNLKYITNLVDDPQLWNAEIVPLDRPEFKVETVDLIESLKQAFEYRPDYEAAKIDLKSQDIRLKVKKNALLPTIDLVGSFGLNGLNRNYEEGLEDLGSGDYRDWSAGVEISFPWGNKEARGDYEKAKLTKAQLLITFARLEQTIILEVRDAVRGVDLVRREVGASLKRRETETRRYEAIEERFREGLVSTHDMLDYQEDLSTAEANYLQAFINYNKALIILDKKVGMTLVKNDITLEEP